MYSLFIKIYNLLQIFFNYLTFNKKNNYYIFLHIFFDFFEKKVVKINDDNIENISKIIDRYFRNKKLINLCTKCEN